MEQEVLTELRGEAGKNNTQGQVEESCFAESRERVQSLGACVVGILGVLVSKLGEIPCPAGVEAHAAV